jgi:hypothetical protein
LLEHLAAEGFLGGIALSSLVAEGDPSISDDERRYGVLVAVTERRTKDEIDRLADAIRKVLQ